MAPNSMCSGEEELQHELLPNLSLHTEDHAMSSSTSWSTSRAIAAKNVWKTVPLVLSQPSSSPLHNPFSELVLLQLRSCHVAGSHCSSCSFSSPVAHALKAGVQEEEETTIRRWFKKVLDVEEAKAQVLFSLPTILTNLFFSLIPLVSVMFAGHIGELELAGATLGNSWANVTGFAFVVGLSGSLETLCGQGFGAKSYRMLGIYLQASCIISLLFCSIISIVWLYTEPILILLHQDPQIAKYAAIFLIYMIPGLFAYGLQQNILRFLQTQSIYVMPMIFSMISILIHIFITYGLLHWTSLGFKGASIAASVSQWISVLMLASHVSCAKNFEHTWQGFSLESVQYVMTGLKLALPSATMECLEEWAFEILVFMGELMPNATITTSLAICVNTQEIGYMVTYGLSVTASTRVSNELGAGHPDRAKKAMLVTLKLALILSVTFVLAITFGHNTWARFFIDSTSDYAVLIDDFASMTPLLAVSIFLDSVQGVFSGVARGCGWQHLAVYVNLGTFYFIGMTIAGVLGFELKLYAKGLWIGLICGLFCQASTLLLITQHRKWTSDFSGNPKERRRPVLDPNEITVA